MSTCVLRVPLSIVCSSFMQVIDQVLARVIQGFVRTLAGVLGIIAVICFNFPLFLVSLPPLAWIYHLIMV